MIEGEDFGVLNDAVDHGGGGDLVAEDLAPGSRLGRQDPWPLRRRDVSQGHRPPLSELYATEIARDTVSRITDAVVKDVAAWRSRPLEGVYPIVSFDAMMVKVREDRSVRARACYLPLGVTCDGEREVLGLWWQQTEGAKLWLAVLNARRTWTLANLGLPPTTSAVHHARVHHPPPPHAASWPPSVSA